MQLPLDLAHAIDAVVRVPHAPHGIAQLRIPQDTRRRLGLMGTPSGVQVVRH